MNVWKWKLIFPTDTLQQKIQITDLKSFFAGENTSVLIVLATTVYKYEINWTSSSIYFWIIYSIIIHTYWMWLFHVMQFLNIQLLVRTVLRRIYYDCRTVLRPCVTLEHKTSLKSHGYICRNSQKYIAWVKIIDFSFMPEISRILSKDHVPWRYVVNVLP